MPAGRFFLKTHHLAELGERLGYLDFLRADGCAAVAGNAVVRTLVRLYGRDGERRYESAAAEGVLVVQREQARDVQPLRAVADSVVAGGTWHHASGQHGAAYPGAQLELGVIELRIG